MKHFTLLLIVALSITEILGKSGDTIFVKQGKPYRFTNPSYPHTDNTGVFEWNFKVVGDHKIILTCDDIMMGPDRKEWGKECPDVSLTTKDDRNERKVCGFRVLYHSHKSSGTKLNVTLKTSKTGKAAIDCTVRNSADVPDQQVVNLKANGKVKKIVFNTYENIQPNLDLKWTFNSPAGTTISYQCDISFPELNEDSVLTLNDGSDQQVKISANLKWQSRANQSSMRFQLSKNGQGALTCTVQAVNGTKLNQYENVPVPMEYTSEEHGVLKGTRVTSCDCGRANRNLKRIMYGTEAKQNEYPWMVFMLIQIQYNATTKAQAGCGGTIITQRHILSAAHCVVQEGVKASPKDVQIHLADHNTLSTTGKEVFIDAEKIFIGDTFMDKGNRYDDIALIFTKQTIEYSDIIGPICLEKEPINVLNKFVRIMGWGLNENYKIEGILKKGRTIVVDNEYCPAPKWSMCTAPIPNGVCEGDSGGPFVIADPETNRYTQVSLGSRVLGANLCKEYSVSTLISAYYDWIQRKIKETDPTVFTCHKV